MAKDLNEQGDPAQLPGEKLVDTVEHANIELVESVDESSGEKKVVVRGEFGRADKPTANKRLYPHGLWESQIKRLSGHLDSRKMLGELDHPADGRTSLKRVSHVITGLSLEGDLVLGEAEIIDTALGKDLKAMLKAGIPIGISSRGYGSVKPHNDGTQVVQEDYKLVTFDFVAEPADSTAYPNVFFEGAEIPAALRDEGDDSEEVVEATDAELQKKIEKIVADGADKPTEEEAKLQKKLEKIVADGSDKPSEEDADLQDKFEKILDKGVPADADALREEFKAEIIDRLSEMKRVIRQDVETELLADPEVAAAKTALEDVKAYLRPFILPEDAETLVLEKEQEIKRLNKEIAGRDLLLKDKDAMLESLASAAKEAGYKFFLERQLSELEDAAIIRKMVGDVAQYASTDELSEAVEEAAEAIHVRRAADEAEKDARVRAEEELRDKNAKLARALEESLSANKQQQILLEAERALTVHPKAANIRQVLENTTLESMEQVQGIIDSYRVEERPAEDVEAVRDRVRTLTQGGASHRGEDSGTAREQSPLSEQQNYHGLGASLRELKKLSGISGDTN
jgi:hypothetical protein